MNKILGAAVATAVMAGGWAGTSAYIGSRIERAYTATYADIEQKLPFLHFADRSVDRGLTSAVYRSKLRVGCPAAKADADADADAANTAGTGTGTGAGTADQTAASFEISFEDHVRHGPVLVGDGLGAAAIDSRITASGDVPQALRDYLARLAPDALHTRVGFDGAYRSIWRLPAADLDIDSGRISWADSRMDMTGRFGAGVATSSWDLPSLSLVIGDADDTSRLTLKGLRMTQRFDGTANGVWLQAGTQTTTIDRLEMALPATDDSQPGPGQLTIDKIKLDQVTSLDGEFVSIQADANIDAMTWTAAQADGAEAKPFKLARVEQKESIRHLHGPTLERLARQAISGVAAMCAGGDEVPTAQLLAGLQQLLLHGPTLSIDKLAAEYEGRRGEISYHIAAPGITQADLDGPPLALLAKLVVKADADVPSAWIDTIAVNGSSGEPSMLTAGTAMVDQLVAQGMLRREDQRLKTSFVFEKGRATANGKPIMPPRPM